MGAVAADVPSITAANQVNPEIRGFEVQERGDSGRLLSKGWLVREGITFFKGSMFEANSAGLRIASDVSLGRDVTIHGFVNLYGCEIGDQTKIGCFVEIQRGSKVGNRCKISSHTFICEGVTIEDDVFIGHGVMFTNDRRPRAAAAGRLLREGDWECQPTVIKKGASIGSGSTILCGLTIGQNAMVGAGSVVTGDIAAGTTVAGNPARPTRNPNNGLT